ARTTSFWLSVLLISFGLGTFIGTGGRSEAWTGRPPLSKLRRQALDGKSATSPCSLADKVSVVLVTSPVGSHPSTQLVEGVISSFDLVAGLSDCPLLVVADGVKVRPGAPRWNQGKVDEEALERYLDYIKSLRTLYAAVQEPQGRPGRALGSTTAVLDPLGRRVNFGHALLEGLKHVETEFVLVVQHDRVFAEPFDLEDALAFFDEYPDKLRYLGFQTSDYQTVVQSKHGKWASCDRPLPASTPGLIPLLMWYDSTHICRTKQYAQLIEKEVKPGEFIESSYGCRLLDQIKSAGRPDAFLDFDFHMDNFGLFLYHDPKIRSKAPMAQ
ncbi:unnamed protein product, partial [Polarella glacialis]